MKFQHVLFLFFPFIAIVGFQPHSLRLLVTNPPQPKHPQVDLFFYREPEETKEPGEDDAPATDFAPEYGATPALGLAPTAAATEWEQGAAADWDGAAAPTAAAPAAAGSDWNAAPAPAAQEWSGAAPPAAAGGKSS